MQITYTAPITNLYTTPLLTSMPPISLTVLVISLLRLLAVWTSAASSLAIITNKSVFDDTAPLFWENRFSSTQAEQFTVDSSTSITAANEAFCGWIVICVQQLCAVSLQTYICSLNVLFVDPALLCCLKLTSSHTQIEPWRSTCTCRTAIGLFELELDCAWLDTISIGLWTIRESRLSDSLCCDFTDPLIHQQ